MDLLERRVYAKGLDTPYASLARRLPKHARYLISNNPIKEILSNDKSVKKIIDLFQDILIIDLCEKDELLMKLAGKSFQILISGGYHF